MMQRSMNMSDVAVNVRTCHKCGYEWTPRNARPKSCPKCKSYTWDKDKMAKWGSGMNYPTPPEKQPPPAVVSANSEPMWIPQPRVYENGAWTHYEKHIKTGEKRLVRVEESYDAA